MKTLSTTISDAWFLLKLSLRQQFGHFYYLIPLTVLVWPAYKFVTLLESSQLTFSIRDVQNELIGLPLYLLAIGLGVGIIAKEVEQDTLEVVYTIPGSIKNFWLIKLVSTVIILLITEVILAVICSAIFTSFPLPLLYSVFQGAVFFLVLAMFFGVLMKNQLAAAVFTSFIFFILYTKFDGWKWSPVFNPLLDHNTSYAEITQNHIANLLMIIILSHLAFFKSQNRENFLG